jgi:cyclopropane fatty-acyl-phospholipid synthase-like methyltransferase
MNHREAVGGLWEEIGELQFDFMVNQGLKPHHKLLDVGCGCLRGGVHFIRYLDEGNYHGVDKDADLLKAGLKEAKMAGLGHKLFHLALDGNFEFDKLETTFDFAIAQSLFTHLNFNEILLCLFSLEQVISDRGKFYATYFDTTRAKYSGTIEHKTADGKVVKTRPAFSRSMHYSLEMLQWAGWYVGMRCIPINEGWEHPRRQSMVVYYK